MADGIPTGRIRRGGRLGLLAAGEAVRGVGIRLSAITATEEARQILAERSTLRTAQQLVTVLGGMKGAAMKFGQMLSVLDLDLVPESHRELFRTKLAELRDRAPAAPFATMRAVMEEELGPLARIFAEVDETPIAAASVGQVYRARLHDGRAVAVKVQYPGIVDAIAADLRNLELLSSLWRSMLPSAADDAVLAEIARNIDRELDYPAEALTQHRIATRYRGHPFITIPDSVPQYCTRRVLVTEFVDGHPFGHLRELPSAERDRIAELIYRFYLTSLFIDHEFCGDPHPGNILLAADGRLAFVDFGLYNHMDPAHVEFERACLRAAAEGRADDLYRAWVGRGIIDPDSGVGASECLDYVRAAAGWHLVDEYLTVTTELATTAVVLAVDPRAALFQRMRQQSLPPEHVFSRRADLFTFATIGQLGAGNNWHRIAREWLYDEAPATEIGRAIAAWRDRRPIRVPDGHE
ncbi:AarF/ABC1/UbiB kinase family protein [Nocardia sp. NBC_01377]|uniref:ABC1 kinase family protein n=1 Tax=Nocardia sp. NBC_01377 TaxID=2903595 RepID=UPI00324CD625